MQTTINIDDQQLKNLMFHTHSKNESEAIHKTIQAHLQEANLKQDLLTLRGQVDIADGCQTLRELEINK